MDHKPPSDQRSGKGTGHDSSSSGEGGLEVGGEEELSSFQGLLVLEGGKIRRQDGCGGGARKSL